MIISFSLGGMFYFLDLFCSNQDLGHTPAVPSSLSLFFLPFVLSSKSCIAMSFVNSLKGLTVLQAIIHYVLQMHVVAQHIVRIVSWVCPAGVGTQDPWAEPPGSCIILAMSRLISFFFPPSETLATSPTSPPNHHDLINNTTPPMTTTTLITLRPPSTAFVW